jgi:Rrf2 family protein
MLALTKKAEYALVAVCHMARLGQRVVSAREIAELHEVPLPLLMNVLKKLNQAGHISSVRGARGGYCLVAAPAKLTLARVIEAVEGPVRLVNCLPGPSSRRRRCTRTGVCAIRQPVHKVHEQLLKFLGAVTVADLAFDEDYVELPQAAGQMAGR